MNRRKMTREIKDLIKREKITTEVKIYKGKKYQMINAGGKYLSIGVCVDNNETNEKEE